MCVCGRQTSQVTCGREQQQGTRAAGTWRAPAIATHTRSRDDMLAAQREHTHTNKDSSRKRRHKHMRTLDVGTRAHLRIEQLEDVGAASVGGVVRGPRAMFIAPLEHVWSCPVHTHVRASTCMDTH